MRDLLPLGTSVAIRVAIIAAGVPIFRTVSRLANPAEPVPVVSLRS